MWPKRTALLDETLFGLGRRLYLRRARIRPHEHADFFGAGMKAYRIEVIRSFPASTVADVKHPPVGLSPPLLEPTLKQTLCRLSHAADPAICFKRAIADQWVGSGDSILNPLTCHFPNSRRALQTNRDADRFTPKLQRSERRAMRWRPRPQATSQDGFGADPLHGRS